MVDLVKTFLTSSLITMQTLVVDSHTMCMHVGGPRNFGDAGPRPLGWGVADSLETCFSARVLPYQIWSF